MKTSENEKAILRIQNDLEDVTTKVDSLAESNKWLFRTVVAAVITAVVGILFTIIRSGVGI